MSERIGFWASWASLLRQAVRTLRAGGSRLIGLILATQIVIVTVCTPLIGWLFREALRASGMPGLDLNALAAGPGLSLTLVLILLICLLAFWLVALQFTLLIIVLQLANAGARITLGAVATEVKRIAQRLIRPSAIPLQLYLFLVLPLTGFGFTSVFTQGIAIPPFVSGELQKSTLNATIFSVFLLLLALLNVRFAVAVPIFTLTDATGGRAIRASWRLTRGLAALPLIGAVIALFTAASALTLGLLFVSLVPTVISDTLSPENSPVVAALSLGVAQTVGLILTGLVTAALAAVLLEFLRRHSDRLPSTIQATSLMSPEQAAAGSTHQPQKRSTLAVGLAIAVVAAVLGTTAITTMQRVASQPETLVLAHRGFSDGGVENTLSGLEAAAAAGADLVEMDVMQTADGKFVAMHDPDLKRLADQDLAVKDLTLDELTQIEVRDQFGHTDLIPSFADYVTRAAELDMPLLIELKLGGLDAPGFVDDLVEELEGLDALESNIYHSLDPAHVARLKKIRPDLSVGYTMPFAAVAPPETPADFIVVEEWTASEVLQQATVASGLSFMVWTVNSPEGQREQLRRGSDGIITDHPDTALASREEMSEETGLAGTLLDMLQRFVVVF